MLRIFKIPNLIHHLETAFNRGLLRLCCFLSAAVLIIHLVACFFHYMAYIEGYNEVMMYFSI